MKEGEIHVVPECRAVHRVDKFQHWLAIIKLTLGSQGEDGVGQGIEQRISERRALSLGLGAGVRSGYEDHSG